MERLKGADITTAPFLVKLTFFLIIIFKGGILDPFDFYPKFFELNTLKSLDHPNESWLSSLLSPF